MGVFGYLAESGYLPLLHTVAWVSIGAVIAYGCIFLFNLWRAPYRQRNEARGLLQARPKPIPLYNKDELLRAMSGVQQTSATLLTAQEQALAKNTRQTAGSGRIASQTAQIPLPRRQAQYITAIRLSWQRQLILQVLQVQAS